MSKIEGFEARAERADRAARASIEAERKAREQKTARLRKLRLAGEAEPQAIAEKPAKKSKKG